MSTILGNTFTYNSGSLANLFKLAFDVNYSDVKDQVNSPEARQASQDLSLSGKIDVNNLVMIVRDYCFNASSTGHVMVDIVQRIPQGDTTHYLTGSSLVGMNFNETFLEGVDISLAEDIMKTISVAHAINTYAFRVGKIYNDVALCESDMEFVLKTSKATSSWFKAANGLAPCEIIHLQEPTTKVITPKLAKELDYDKCILGASSGKESTFNNFILKDAGYETHNVTFKNLEDIHSEGASMELVCLDDTNLTYVYLYPLTIQAQVSGEKVAFDAQGVISIPRYAMLIIEALKFGAGNLAVGTEFGCSKIWYPHEPENLVKGNTIHDLAVDEGAFICQQLESIFTKYGLDVYIIAPTSVLHEVGILRALVDIKKFNLADLKSCWRANYLQHNYCGLCYKCQRLAKYFNYLQGKHPKIGFKSFIDFDDLNFASGTMLSYSMQYHIFEQHPELPWSTALCIDNENMRLLDYRTGNRLLKVLVNQYNFKDIILPSLYDNPNNLILQSSANIVYALKDYLNIDYIEELKSKPERLNHCFLELPGEKEFADSLTEEMQADLQAHAVEVGRILGHTDSFPIFGESKNGIGKTWKWLTLDRVYAHPEIPVRKLELSQKALDHVLVRRWLAEKSVVDALTHYGIKFTIED